MIRKFSNAPEPVDATLEINEFGLEPIPDIQCTFEVVSERQVARWFLHFKFRPHPSVNVVSEKFDGACECFIIERVPDPGGILENRIERFITGDDGPWLA